MSNCHIVGNHMSRLNYDDRPLIGNNSLKSIFTDTVLSITVCHLKACLVMTNGVAKGMTF